MADFVEKPDEDTAAGGRLVALIGVNDLVVDTQDALLITAPERAKEVEQILETLTVKRHLDLT